MDKKICALMMSVFLFLCLSNCPGMARADDLDALFQQVVSLYQQGRYEQAIPVARELLQKVKAQYGENHPKTATAYNNLAELYDSRPLLRGRTASQKGP